MSAAALTSRERAGQAAAPSFVPIGIIHIQADDGTAIIYGIIGCCMLLLPG